MRWGRRKGWVKGDLNSGGWKMTVWFITDVGNVGVGLCWGRRGLRRGELVSQGCRNATDRVAYPVETRISQFWRLEVHDQDVTGLVLSEGLFQASLLAFGSSLAHGSIIPVFTWCCPFASVCVQISPFYRDTSDIGLGAHSTPVLSHLKFPNNIIFWGTGG